MFLWSDSVTKITGNHTFKAGVSVERSGMKDQIQLSSAQAPATTNQNGSFRFIDATRADGTGLAVVERAARAVRRLHRVRQQAADQLHRHGLRLLRAGQLEADAPTDAGARPALLAVAAVARREQRHRVVPVAVLRSGARRSIDRAGGFVRAAAIRSTASSCPATAPTEEALAEFPQLADLGRLYHGVPTGFRARSEGRLAAAARDGLRAERR